MGGGGREDALSWRLAQSPSVEAVFAAPGNAGTASRGVNWPIAVTDGKKLTERARSELIDLVVLGPENAIAAGVGDHFRDAGIAVFGPNRSGGRLESSKIFAKKFLERYEIPTARAQVARSLDQALKVLDDWPGGGVAIKADGLAAGKGVVVAPDAETARTTVKQWYLGSGKIPGGGTDILLEEKMEGREVSVFAICDGRAMLPIAAACDYKRAGDGDTGPNTGGMGAYSPPAGFPRDFMDSVRERIVGPTLRGLLSEGEKYIGILYFGIMWTADGPKVVEYNARFGDPETQALMPRVQGDFAKLLRSAADGALEPDAATFSRDACVGVTLVTAQYPVMSTAVAGLPASLNLPAGTVAFWGNSALRSGRVDAGGGRVLTVAATAEHLSEARARAYEAISRLAEQIGPIAPLAYRSDIAKGV